MHARGFLFIEDANNIFGCILRTRLHCRFCKEMNAWVNEFHLGRDIIEAALASMQTCSLVHVQRKRLYTVADFAATQRAHQAKVSHVATSAYQRYVHCEPYRQACSPAC